MTANLQVSSHESIEKKRIVFVDGLRGIAAIMVLLFHNQGFWLKNADSGYLSAFMFKLTSYGYLGVDIFFVISGFSIACSLRNFYLDRNSLFIFLMRRVTRLTPLYYTSLFISIFLAFLFKYLLHSNDVFPLPSGLSFLVHLSYTQYILGFPEINPVYWTLCIEIQFYLVFALLLVILRKMLYFNTNIKLDNFIIYSFTLIGFLSYLFPLLHISKFIPVKGLFLEYWYMFSTGTIIYWSISKLIPQYLVYFLIFSLSLTLLNFHNPGLLVSSLTAITIYVASVSGGLYTWLASKPFQFLGRISYSVYIVHTPIAIIALGLCNRFSHRTDLNNLIFFSCSAIVSIILANILFLIIESPSINWSRRFKIS